MMEQNKGFAWDDTEKGHFREDFFPPINCEGPKDARRFRDNRVRMGQPLKLKCDYNGATNIEARGG